MARHRQVRAWPSLVIAVLLVVVAICFYWLQPISFDAQPGAEPIETWQQAPTSSEAPTLVTPSPVVSSTSAVPTSQPSQSPKPVVTTKTVPPRSCKVGKPLRLEWKTIGIDAKVVPVGLHPEDGGLAAPSDRTTIGVYSAGPMPGQGRGNVLIDGHTYRNNSAVFKEDFSQKVAKGMVLSLAMDNGSICSYRITNIWPNIPSGDNYASLVKSEKFYDFTGPEQLFGVTCSGSWNVITQSHSAVTAFVAAPIN